MENIILIAVIVAVIALAAAFVVRFKRKGKGCIGCPSGGCRSCDGCNKCGY